jgi:hypothetical protein
MPKYEVNQHAVAHARQLIEARRYVISIGRGEQLRSGRGRA